MKYNAMSQRRIILLMAFLFLIVSIGNWDYADFKWPSLIIFTIALLIAFIKYTLVIENHTIIYTIQLFSVRIYNKKVTPPDIEKIIFKRIGWKSKLATIKLDKGLPIRVALFKPENVYDDLVTFCEENTIHYKKTKDYKIIEK